MPLLTKSRYRLGCECPTKIFYGNDRNHYTNTKSDNEFLKALAEGGFQVGELARLMYPGSLVDTLTTDKALAETTRLLAVGPTTIHEAAFTHAHFLIRADILIKKGNTIDLIEVKSKSYGESDPKGSILTAKNEIRSAWLPYIQDIAFQTFVVRLAHPTWEVKPYLLLVNKEASAPIDGINSLFRCRKEGDKVLTTTPNGVPDAVLASDLLIKIDVSDAVEKVLTSDYEGETFQARAERWAIASVAGTKLVSPIGASKCSNCEFRATASERAEGKLSGFHECWSAATRLSVEEIDSPFVLQIWNYRGKQVLLDQRKYLLRNAAPADIVETKSEAPPSGWSATERQRIQVRCVRDGNNAKPVVDEGGLRAALSRLVFPIHFIDFETTRCALPFHKGETPYGNIAFQFSHHTVEADGQVRHANEWISLARGIQPNESFARALRDAIGNDSGSILHYAAHERTVLNDIPATCPDPELAAWIRSILPQADGTGGTRMVDMKEIILRHYYHPLARGSNSLKAILPSILQTSRYLDRKYKDPIYGTPAMPSRNFTATAWITEQTTDPYSMLPKLESSETEDRFFNEDSINQGGAAMVAYAKCQFADISIKEVNAIRAALLKYCELDTLAMVMLWETWKYDHGA
jgi:hypothetical protein